MQDRKNEQTRTRDRTPVLYIAITTRNVTKTLVTSAVLYTVAQEGNRTCSHHRPETAQDPSLFVLELKI